MMTLKRKHQQNKQRNKQPAYCPECHNTGRCKRCQGLGCVDCNYIGDFCPHCGHSSEYYENVEGIIKI